MAPQGCLPDPRDTVRVAVSAYLTIAHYNARVILACPETGS